MKLSTAWMVGLTALLIAHFAEAQEAAGQSDPCAGVECSGHGICALYRWTPACLCDDGYRRARSVECVEDTFAGQEATEEPALSVSPGVRRRRQGVGLGLTITGAALIGTGVALGLAAIVDIGAHFLSPGGRDNVELLLLGGVIGFVVGLALLIPGAITLRRANRHARIFRAFAPIPLTMG